MNESTVHKPMFSVFMPCYNHGEYVATAIESILNQTFQDFELIVADNGSLDNSWEVINRYKDRIQIMRLEKNNPFGCSKMLVEKCTGKYLCQMAADDYWEPRKLELQAKAIEEHPDCVAWFTWAVFTDESLNVTDDKIFAYQNRNRFEWIRTIFDQGTVLAINTMAILNDPVIYNKYMDKGIRQYWQLTDQKQIIQMLLEGEVYVVEESCMKIRRSENCIGHLSDETEIRTSNEEISIWNDMWENMTDQEFLEIFHEDLYDREVSDPVEVQCERMLVFLKLAQNVLLHQTTANNYFIRHYSDPAVKTVMEEKYGFTAGDFHLITGRSGFGLLYRAYQLEIHRRRSGEGSER